MTCQCGGKAHSRWVHWWQRMSARSLHVEITYFHSDDETESAREINLEVPDWIYRPRCWLKSCVSDGYGGCVFCRRPLSSP